MPFDSCTCGAGGSPRPHPSLHGGTHCMDGSFRTTLVVKKLHGDA